MPGSKKRLKKGINSLQKQIDLHEEKKRQAELQENPELARYYGDEIEGLIKEKLRREYRLKKK